MKRALYFAFLLPFVWSCTTSSDNETIELMPLEIGNQWELKYTVDLIVTPFGTIDVVDTLEVVSDTIVDGIRWFSIENIGISNSRQSVTQPFQYYWSNQEDGLHQRFFDRFNLFNNAEEALTHYRSDISSGETYTFSSVLDVQTITLATTSRIDSLEERGFEYRVNIDSISQSTLDGDRITDSVFGAENLTRIFVPGYGPIYWEREWFNYNEPELVDEIDLSGRIIYRIRRIR